MHARPSLSRHTRQIVTFRELDRHGGQGRSTFTQAGNSARRSGPNRPVAARMRCCGFLFGLWARCTWLGRTGPCSLFRKLLLAKDEWSSKAAEIESIPFGPSPVGACEASSCSREVKNQCQQPDLQKRRGKQLSTARCGLRQVKSEGCQLKKPCEAKKGHFRPKGSSCSSTKI